MTHSRNRLLSTFRIVPGSANNPARVRGSMNISMPQRISSSFGIIRNAGINSAFLYSEQLPSSRLI